MAKIFWGFIYLVSYFSIIAIAASPYILTVLYRNPQWLWAYALLLIPICWAVGDKVGKPW